MISNSNAVEFYRSLRDSQANFIEALAVEKNNGYSDALESMERRYEEGFIDGMRHAFTLLTGYAPEGLGSAEIEHAITYDEITGEVQDLCRHDDTLKTDGEDGSFIITCNYCEKTLYQIN